MCVCYVYKASLCVVRRALFSLCQERPAPCMHDLPLRQYLDTCPDAPAVLRR